MEGLPDVRAYLRTNVSLYTSGSGMKNSRSVFLVPVKTKLLRKLTNLFLSTTGQGSISRLWYQKNCSHKATKVSNSFRLMKLSLLCNFMAESDGLVVAARLIALCK